MKKKTYNLIRYASIFAYSEKKGKIVPISSDTLQFATNEELINESENILFSGYPSHNDIEELFMQNRYKKDDINVLSIPGAEHLEFLYFVPYRRFYRIITEFYTNLYQVQLKELNGYYDALEDAAIEAELTYYAVIYREKGQK